MATSNNTIWQLTRDEIINASLRKIGVVGEGVSANAQQLTDAAQALNAVIAEFQTLGMLLWKRVETAIPLTTASTYRIGIGQTVNTPFPLKVSQANLVLSGSSTNLDMTIISRNEFNNLPTAVGTPIQLTYQPFVNYGEMTVWPSPDVTVPSGSTVVLTYHEAFDYFTAGTQTADFPQEWHNALVYGLASSLADEYSLPLDDRKWIERQADKRLSIALSSATEEVSSYFYPDRGA
jgi:hypothetical protein